MKGSKLFIAGLSLLCMWGGAFAIAQETVIDTAGDTTTSLDSYQPDQEVSDFDVQNASSSLQDLQNSVDSITNELYSLDAKERTGDTISAKYREVRNEIVKVIQSINTATDTVSDILKKIALYKKLILSAYQEVQDSRVGITDTKEYIETFTNFIYKLDNKLYNEDTNTIDDVKLIIHSDNIPRTLANDYLVESMLLQFNDLLNNFTNNEEQQLELIKKLNQLKISAKSEITDYQVELEKLQQKKNYLLQFISLYKDDKITQEMSINNLFDSTKSVYDKVIQLVGDVKKGVYQGNFDMDKKIDALKAITDDTQTYPLARPLYPIENILTYFGDTEYQKQYGIPHIGIQIKATQGTPVYASRDAVVYFVADNDDIGINRVMLVHTDGYVTVYEYLNRSIVKPGDIIKRGQLIGYSGGEPGTRGAGFISKGSNLSFIVFKDAIALDPFDILDASIVKDKDVLPNGYQIKYLRDKYARAIDITNLELMTGSSLLEREDQFLSRYGVGIYKEVPFWEDVVKGTNIDRDVVICIAFAESTLGRYLSTAGNIGNVGNNDRGDRVPFYSAYQGARAIPLTLNNVYLGDYHTINQLSRYGNKDGKIYASSPINRQTNVLKCLSQIKGYYIPEDFPFRIGPNPNIGSGTQETVQFGDVIIATTGTVQ
ncbi:MAG: peptidoglycan DD-metalloendopeptidase family protein [Candidatus Absconditabacterales bacterium]